MKAVMKIFLILLLGVCIFEHNYVNAIHGGYNVMIEQHPYMAFIVPQIILVPGVIPIPCGAFIIGRRYIVTAAHCAPQVLPYAKVKVGKTIYSDGINYDIKEICYHPNPSYNVALVILKEDLVFSSSIATIPYSSPTDSDIPQGSIVNINGWGQTQTNSPYSLNLQSASLTVVNHTECVQKYSLSTTIVTDNTICAGAPGIDWCFGDGGGPLVRNNIAVGVMGRTDQACEDTPNPVVAAKIKPFSSWLTNFMSCYDIYNSCLPCSIV